VSPLFNTPDSDPQLANELRIWIRCVK